jgi:type VI protein secretion system component Hcp
VRNSTSSSATFLIALLITFCFSSAASAQAYSLIRMTDVPGNSTIPGYTADYLGSGVDFRPLQVSKPSDETDPQVFEFLAKQTNVQDVCVLAYSSGGPGSIRKLSAIGLKNAKITNLTPATAVNGVEQTFTLTYEEISVISYTYNLNGDPTGQTSYCVNAIQGGTCPGGLLSCPINN